MKKILIPIVVIAALGGIVWSSMSGSFTSEKGTKVYAELSEQRDISNIVKASGQIDPRVKVNVSAHIVAKIEKLYVEEGQEVEKGQPFLELEKETLQAIQQQSAAQLQINRSQLRQAKIDLEDADIKRNRAERLQMQGIASSEALETAVLAQRSAQLRVEQAEESIQQAQANLNKAQDDLRKTTIYSPLTGRVISLQAEEGEVVVSGTMNNAASVIGVVADLSEVLADVDVDETEIVDVALGQTAKILVDAVTDFEYTGTVVEIASSGFQRPQQPDVTFFKVKVLIDSPDERLRPGMSTRAEIEVATHRDTVVVPIQTVVYRKPLTEGVQDDSADDIKVVFRMEGGKAVQTPVEIGITDTTHAEITSGLEAGVEVITGPSRTLKKLEHDEAVRVEKEKDTKSEKDSKDEDDGDE
ncbi:MAG: efflux RND transporter periplasmic adaptor subunit [Thermoanaerobaculia bacterium]|nr:efflux RND transporter periplasmic adaptor subunit [Thermoanaerobaculia bacterium]